MQDEGGARGATCFCRSRRERPLIRANGRTRTPLRRRRESGKIGCQTSDYAPTGITGFWGRRSGVHPGSGLPRILRQLSGFGYGVTELRAGLLIFSTLYLMVRSFLKPVIRFFAPLRSQNQPDTWLFLPLFGNRLSDSFEDG